MLTVGAFRLLLVAYILYAAGTQWTQAFAELPAVVQYIEHGWVMCLRVCDYFTRGASSNLDAGAERVSFRSVFEFPCAYSVL